MVYNSLMKYILCLLFLIPGFLYAQEIIKFDDFSVDGYENRVMYVELKKYENNLTLVNKYKELTKEMPSIKKYSSGDNTFFTFTGYVIENTNDIIVIDVMLKLVNDDITIINEKLLDGFDIENNEIDSLIKNSDDSEEFIISEGSDLNGSFITHKKLFKNDSDEIEDNFSMMYAMIIHSNLENIRQENISRRLMYYILEFTY